MTSTSSGSKRGKARRAPVGRPPGAESNTRERVLKVAVELFAKQGYHATGVAEIGEMAGLQRGALYYHIGSKEDLLLVVMRRHVEDSLEGEEKILASDLEPAKKLRELLRHHVRIATERSAESAIYMRDAGALSGARARELQALRERVEQVWASVVSEGEAAGVFRKSDPVIINGLLSVANFVFIWYRPGGRLTPDQIADQYADVLLGGLLIRPGK